MSGKVFWYASAALKAMPTPSGGCPGRSVTSVPPTTTISKSWDPARKHADVTLSGNSASKTAASADFSMALISHAILGVGSYSLSVRVDKLVKANMFVGLVRASMADLSADTGNAVRG